MIFEPKNPGRLIQIQLLSFVKLEIYFLISRSFSVIGLGTLLFCQAVECRTCDGLNVDTAFGRHQRPSPKISNISKMDQCIMAERVGFEPTIPLQVCRISSAVHSTTLPPLRMRERLRCALLININGGADKGNFVFVSQFVGYD